MRQGESIIAPGHFVIEAGETANHIYVLLEGWGLVYPRIPNRPLRATEIALPGDIIGLQGGLTGTFSHSVIALTRARCCVIDGALPRKIAEIGGSLSIAQVKHLVHERSRRERMAALLGGENPMRRLAYLFLETFSRLKAIGIADEMMCPFPVRLRHVAEIVGLSEVHLSRMLAKMRKAGIVELANNILCINDRDALIGTAGLNPADWLKERFIL